MSRDTKILAASGILGVVVAIAKSGSTDPTVMVETAKAEIVPLAVNLIGLGLLLKFIK